MKYEAPALVKYGRIEQLTASDMKCSPGADMYGYRVPWVARHDPMTPGEEWDEVGRGGQLTGRTATAIEYAARLDAGVCAGANAGVHPVTGK